MEAGAPPVTAEWTVARALEVARATPGTLDQLDAVLADPSLPLIQGMELDVACSSRCAVPFELLFAPAVRLQLILLLTRLRRLPRPGLLQAFDVELPLVGERMRLVALHPSVDAAAESLAGALRADVAVTQTHRHCRLLQFFGMLCTQAACDVPASMQERVADALFPSTADGATELLAELEDDTDANAVAVRLSKFGDGRVELTLCVAAPGGDGAAVPVPPRVDSSPLRAKLHGLLFDAQADIGARLFLGQLLPQIMAAVEQAVVQPKVVARVWPVRF